MSARSGALFCSEQRGTRSVPYTRDVHVDPRSPAEATEIFLQEGTRSGVPVIIPGAREPRVSRPAVQLTPNIGAGANPGITPDLPSRRQLEYEREGGGAPSERLSVSQRARGVRALDWLLRRG
jgi:hypothetical protein